MTHPVFATTDRSAARDRPAFGRLREWGRRGRGRSASRRSCSSSTSRPGDRGPWLDASSTPWPRNSRTTSVARGGRGRAAALHGRDPVVGVHRPRRRRARAARLAAHGLGRGARGRSGVGGARDLAVGRGRPHHAQAAVPADGRSSSGRRSRRCSPAGATSTWASRRPEEGVGGHRPDPRLAAGRPGAVGQLPVLGRARHRVCVVPLPALGALAVGRAHRPVRDARGVRGAGAVDGRLRRPPRRRDDLLRRPDLPAVPHGGDPGGRRLR